MEGGWRAAGPESVDGPGCSRDRVRAVVVCTANVCRSPFAEALLREDARGWNGLELVVESAGTFAEGHSGVCAELWRIRSMPSPTGHRPTQVEPRMLDEADLVLALAADHRAGLAKLSPGSRARTFTLNEVAVLAAAVTADGGPLDAARGRIPISDPFDPLSRVEPIPAAPHERFRWLVREIDAARGSVVVEGDSIADPHESDTDIHRRAADGIRSAVESIGRSVRATLAG